MKSGGVARLLRANAAAFRDKDAVVFPVRAGFERLSYRELDARSDRYAAGLRRIGIDRGVKTVLMVKPGPELFVLAFALFKVGAVPVIVDPGMGLRRMMHCYREVGAEAFIGVPAAHAMRVLNPGVFGALKARVTVGRRWFWGGHTLADLDTGEPGQVTTEIGEDDLLVINFTTGSTGPAKGVEYTHRTLVAMAQEVERTQGHCAEDVSLATVPLFGLLDLLIGATTVLAPLDPARVADADPATLADVMARFEVTTMFASPALLRPLTEHLAQTGRTLPALRRVIAGGAPVTDSVVDGARTALGPDVLLMTTYGATEALPISSISAAEILDGTRKLTQAGYGTCVGRPVPGIEVRTVRITDKPLTQWSDDLLTAPGEVGELVVAGDHVSNRYHGSPVNDIRAKIHDGARRWHRTGDLARIDAAGRIWFCGRKTHRVDSADGTLFSVCCEGVFNAHPDVLRTALVEVGGRPVMCFEPVAGTPRRELPRITAELRELGGRQQVTEHIRDFRPHPGFPVDIRHNAKIGRELLAEWAAAPRVRPNALWLVPLAGWAYLLYGLVWPLENPALQALFWIDVLLSVVVHGLQIPVALSRARPAGRRPRTTVFLTMLLGATWWKRLPGGRR
ncbi:AMP-binding protein [Amycolatopsis sp. SID8362]|nr:AMP-binding protein [Amycolatopsis sp. SID8362]NED42776.1 AMP-binding protein [Amycolatopsis sp. SID8362]